MSEEDQTLPYAQEQYEYAAAASPLPYIEHPAKPSPDIQPQQPTEQPAALTEIGQLAATYQLGRERTEHKNDASKPLTAGLTSFVLGLSLCLLPFFALAFAGVAIFRLGMIIAGIASIVYGISRLTVAINYIAANALNGNLRFYLFSNGVMTIRRNRVQALRWDQIKVVSKSLDYKGFPVQYVLSPADDGEPLVLDPVGVGLKIPGEHIEREVARRLLPEAIAAYEAGQTLDFGPLKVSQEGLSLQGKQKVLPWKLLSYLDTMGDSLVIDIAGRTLRWAKIEAAELFNLCVLLPLVKQIRRDYLSKENKPQPTVSYLPPTGDLSQSEWQAYE
ncbi:MAG: hypothetical protein JOZ18_16065 [Chloroflexi bacterium]|nr:hypothetical protein [Chloroflexota bacterium]